MPKQAEPKAEKKTRARHMVVINPPLGLEKGHEFSVKIGDELIICPWEVRLVTMHFTPEEREKARRIYRQNYMKRPDTVAKVRERMSDPEIVQKRKEYAERADVKLRKKELAARARMIKRTLKETQPENYESIKMLVEEELARNTQWMKDQENGGSVHVEPV